jgi:predicted phage-related endonuclease
MTNTAKTVQDSTQRQRRVTDADWSEIRGTTVAAHETPALFESVAENAEISDDHDDFETDAGTPVSAYGSPLSLWEMKTGRFKDAGSNKRGLWSRIKFGVITAACEERGLETRKPLGVYLHPEIDFMSSRVDQEVTEDGGATWQPLISFPVAGTVSDMWRNATGDWTPPEYVLLQAYHHMAVTGAEKCFVVGLFGGITIRFFTVERDEEMIEDIVETIRSFWACVEEDRRPAASGARDMKVLQRLCSKIDPETEIIDKRNDREFLALIEQKATLAAQKTAIEKQLKGINAQLAEHMDGVGAAVISDFKQIAWSFTAAAEVSYTRSASATLRTKKISDKAAGTPIGDLVKA